MPFYTQEQLDRVRKGVDIVDIIGRRVALRRSGASYCGPSPFSDGDKRGLSVTPQKQLFKCWKSGIGGDVFKFVMAADNVNFPEAVRRVAEMGGIRL